MEGIFDWPNWALAGDIPLCSWTRHLQVTLTVPLSTQEMDIDEINAEG